MCRNSKSSTILFWNKFTLDELIHLLFYVRYDLKHLYFVNLKRWFSSKELICQLLIKSQQFIFLSGVRQPVITSKVRHWKLSMRATVSDNNVISKLRPVVRVIANSMISVLILHDLLTIDREYESLFVFLPKIIRLNWHRPEPSKQMEAIIVGGTSCLDQG